MNTRLGKSFGLAFVVAVGILALMFALGTFSAQQVGAAPLTDAQIENGSVKLETSSKTPGAATSVTISAKLEGALVAAADNTIEINLGDFDEVALSPLAIVLDPITAESLALITYSDDDTAGDASIASAAVGGTQRVTLTLSNTAIADDTTITVEFAVGFGFQIPAANVTAIGGEFAGEAVAAADQITIGLTSVVELDTSTDSAGAAARVVVKANTVAAIEIGDEIKIGLGGFGVPPTIGDDDVLIRDGTGAAIRTAAPADVSVSKTTITLLVPDMDLAEATSAGIGAGEFTIIFQQDAGITIPTASGRYWATVNGIPDNISTKAEMPAGTVAPSTPNLLTVSRSLSLSPTTGARGKEVTATGKGFSGSEATLWVDENGDGTVNSAERVLGSSISVDKGVFSHTFTVPSGTSFKAGKNNINAIDGTGGKLASPTTFTVTAGISLDKQSVKPGEALKLTISDFEDLLPGEVGGAAALTIGGAPVTSKDITSSVSSPAGIVVTITVPVDNLPSGMQDVKVTKGNNSAKASVNISALPLTTSLASAVPGQEITIRGQGFTGGAQVKSVKIGEVSAISVNSPPILINNSGNFVATVTIPKTAGGTGDVQVEVIENGDEGTAGVKDPRDGNSRIGTATIAIPKPTLTLNPETSRPGTSVSASGTGFVAGANVGIVYNSGSALTSVNAGSTGSWTTSFVVPVNIDVGTTNVVIASNDSLNQAGKSATAEHTVPGGVLSVSPTEGPPGTQVTVTGDGFKAYSSVVEMTIGTLSVLTTAINTDENGDFMATLLLPTLPAGTHSLYVAVGGTKDVPSNTESLAYTVTSGVAAARASEDAFADLITAGVLTVVWHFDNDTKAWSFYDPRPEVAAAVDLTEVSSGDNVWIQVTADVDFQDEMLTTGWNLHTLK